MREVIFISLIMFNSLRCYVETGTAPLFCPAGTFLVLGTNSGNESCSPCVPGFFNDQNMHRQVSCEKCTSYSRDDLYYQVVGPCTPVHNTLVRCRHKEFHYSHQERRCIKCSVCETQRQYVGRRCTDFNDTVCCPEKDMVFIGEECQLITYCGVGQYLEYGKDSQRDNCMPCPMNTTNYEFHHRRTSCRFACYDSRKWNEHHLTERSLTCGSEKCEVGKSCVRENGVICAPCTLEAEKSPKKEEVISREDNSRYQLKKNDVSVSGIMDWESLSLTLSAASVVSFIVCVCLLMRQRQSNKYVLLSDRDDSEQCKI